MSVPVENANSVAWSPSRATRWLVPLGLALLGVICLVWVDAPVAGRFSQTPLDGELERLFDAAEHFGTPFGQILIALTIAAFASWWEPRLTRILTGAFAAGIMANVGKLLVARQRPSAFAFTGDATWDSFHGLFPLGEGGSAFQSFPSAHTASAFGFACLLSWAFPRGRGLFFFFATLTALHRVQAGSHYPSDVCLGAALGWIVGTALIVPGPVARGFDRLEEKLARMRPGWARTVETKEAPPRAA